MGNDVGNMFKIGLTGWYGKQNLGDELLKQIIQQFYNKHKVTVLEPSQTADADIDVVVFGGGTSYMTFT